MTFAAIRTIALMAVCAWGCFSLLKDAAGRGENLRWYDRSIRLLGAVLMAALVVGGYLLMTGKLK